MYKTLIAMLIASMSLSAYAQTTNITEPARTETMSSKLVPQAKAGMRSTAALENLTLSGFDQLEEAVKASTLSEEEKAKKIAAINEQRAQARTYAESIKKTITILGTPYAVIGIVLTYAVEFIPVKIGHFGLGVQGEFGIIGTQFSAGAPRWSGVGISGPLFEWYPEVNVTQNRVGSDHGIHVKFILANVVNSHPIQHASELEGVYVGGGFDLANGFSGKIYAGGCFHDSDEVRKEYPRGWYDWSKILGYDIPYPTAMAAMNNHWQNCNTLAVSASRSFNPTAPPVSFPLKPFKMWIIDTVGKEGWVPFERR